MVDEPAAQSQYFCEHVAINASLFVHLINKSIWEESSCET